MVTFAPTAMALYVVMPERGSVREKQDTPWKLPLVLVEADGTDQVVPPLMEYEMPEPPTATSHAAALLEQVRCALWVAAKAAAGTAVADSAVRLLPAAAA